MADHFRLTRPLCGSRIAQSSHRYMRPVCFHNCTMCSYVDYGLITIHMLISILQYSQTEHLASPHCDPPSSDLPSCSHNHTDTHLHPSPMVIPMQCCAMLCCCVCVTWPLPFHAIVQQTDAVPPSTLIIPVIPISTVPAEPAVISSSTSQVFFYFSIFPLHTLPPLFFCSLPVGHFSWSLPFLCSLMGLKDYQPQSRVKYHGSPWLIASACQPAGGSGKPHRKTDREIEQASKRESGFNFRLLLARNSIHASALHVLQYKMPCTYICWQPCVNLVWVPVMVNVRSWGE